MYGQKQKLWMDGHKAKVLINTGSEPAKHRSKKLLLKYKEPSSTRTVLLTNRYKMEDLLEGFIRLQTVVAVDRIKFWISIQGEYYCSNHCMLEILRSGRHTMPKVVMGT